MFDENTFGGILNYSSIQDLSRSSISLGSCFSAALFRPQLFDSNPEPEMAIAIHWFCFFRSFSMVESLSLVAKAIRFGVKQKIYWYVTGRIPHAIDLNKNPRITGSKPAPKHRWSNECFMVDFEIWWLQYVASYAVLELWFCGFVPHRIPHFCPFVASLQLLQMFGAFWLLP